LCSKAGIPALPATPNRTSILVLRQRRQGRTSHSSMCTASGCAVTSPPAGMFSARLTDPHRRRGKRAFDAVVVNEAKDVGIPELRFLAIAGSRCADGLFLTGDLRAADLSAAVLLEIGWSRHPGPVLHAASAPSRSHCRDHHCQGIATAAASSACIGAPRVCGSRTLFRSTTAVNGHYRIRRGWMDHDATRRRKRPQPTRPGKVDRREDCNE
jgi:hypothetical protein